MALLGTVVAAVQEPRIMATRGQAAAAAVHVQAPALRDYVKSLQTAVRGANIHTCMHRCVQGTKKRENISDFAGSCMGVYAGEQLVSVLADSIIC